MRIIESPKPGSVSMDPRVRYTNSIKGHETEKRHLRMSDKEEAEYQKKRLEYFKKLRELRNEKKIL